MSSKIFQSIITRLKDSVDRTVGIIDDTGVIIACTDLTKIGLTRREVRDELQYTSENLHYKGCTYKTLSNGVKNDYAVFVDGEDDESAKFADILSVTLQGIKSLYDDKYDKASFIKNVILDNVLPSDIYAKSRELHFNTDCRRIIFIVRFPEHSDIVPLQMMQNMYPDKNKDFVIGITETEIALVKEVRDTFDDKEAEKIACTIRDTFSTEFFTNVTIGIGTVVESIKELAKSYKEARTAIEIGRVFDNDKSIISYKCLGIGRLIYQLPTTLCELFLDEIFSKGALESIDRETLATVSAFFENNLNISETARKLFVHRNTLVYRLDKIEKITGLDLREFDNAITFKVALMVKKYLKTKPVKY